MSFGYELLAPFTTADGEIIPLGFEWDGATIPRFAWSIVGGPFHPEVMAPSLEHDYDYWTRRKPRQEADDNLYHNLIGYGCSKARAFTMWKAVRAFGGAYFKRENADVDYAEALYKYIQKVRRDNWFMDVSWVDFMKYFPTLEDL